MKEINLNELNPVEYRFFAQNNQRLSTEIKELHQLLDYPPFAMDESGFQNTELINDYQSELEFTVDNIDQNDMVGEIFKPFKQFESKFKTEIQIAREMKNAGMSQYDALKKWVADKKITLDPGVAYYYGL